VAVARFFENQSGAMGKSFRNIYIRNESKWRVVAGSNALCKHSHIDCVEIDGMYC